MEMKKLKGFAVSWFFAPYIGSADLDFFKRIKDTNLSYTVVQAARERRDDQVLKYASTDIERIELQVDHANPRTQSARAGFVRGVLDAFARSEENYDFIISHSNELISHAAAAEIKKLHPNIPWIVYFGDLFVRNPYVTKGFPLADEDRTIERDTLRLADRVIVNNTYQRDLMFTGDLAPLVDKSVVVPHCFDPSMYPPTATHRNDKFVFSHLGMLYYIKRTATPVLRAVDRLLEIYPEYRGRFEVRFYGASPGEQDLHQHAAMRNPSHVRFEKPVSYAESLRLMCEADALLLIDGLFSQEEDGLDCNPFFPGKLTDYMGARRPIASVTMPKGPTAEIMARAGNLVADGRIDRIAYVLKRYIDQKITPDYSVYNEYTVDNIAPLMESAIRSAIKV
ncbi:hypothetical protein [Bordetella sp. BOR01]|uniref:hypothetical protein n=1 Tax=Bordetella sp. BOR01 TaxID=2854779 RepID=UPI001C455816|nr:hypothetical protein [Bordetella sp. BOR01]MBV7485442.1 hypothetical protein [Bordetella sp. BOR01]